MKKCAIGDCDKNSHARGFCRMHYSRLMINGSPLIVRDKNLVGLGKGRYVTCPICEGKFISRSNLTTVCSTECRFLSYSNEACENDCWEWTGPINNQGYAVLSISDETKSGVKKVVSGHRYAYERHNGRIPCGAAVMHVCDNRKCVNPSHLLAGSWADNNRDRSQKGRSGSKIYSDEDKKKYSLIFRGAGNPLAKLTETQAKEIKYDRTLGSKKASEKYGVSTSLIKNIRSGRAWKHI